MKVKSTLFHSLIAAAALLLLAPQVAHGQSGRKFTISNGTAQWLESETGTPYPIAYKQSGVPMFSSDAVQSSQVTYDITAGSIYIKLDTTGNASIVGTSTFDQFCVWESTDNPGYCYQEYTVADGSKTYRYYLRGTGAGDLAVWKVERNEHVATGTLWVGGEGGGYIDQSYVRNGVKYVDYRWFAFNGTTPVMSCGAEHRPEARRYIDAGNTVYSYFCPNSLGTGSDSKAGVLLPVEVVSFEPSFAHPQGTNVILQNIALNLPSGKTVLGLAGDTAVSSTNPTVLFNAAVSGAGASVQYTQAYDKVTTYSRLKGLNFNGIGKPGTMAYEYGDRGILSNPSTYYIYADGSVNSTAPSVGSLTVHESNVTSYQWSIDNGARRYLTLSGEDTPNPTLTCVAIPAGSNYTASLSLTITTDNGASESFAVNVVVCAETGHIVKTESENSVFVQGDVFGGGRMANVEGATDVLVINCDTISRVYGGNDISGTVANGSTVTIGNSSSSDYIGINSVYGAGNGYYSYGGTSQGFSVCNTPIAAGTEVRQWGDNGGEVIATAAEATNVPLIYKTRVFINSPWARLDTVFGGARNADVLPQDPSVTYATSTTIADHDTLASVTVNAGSIFAVFGGNNVGGCMNGLFADAANSYTRTAVNINMTNIQGVTPAQAIAGTGTPSWSTDTAVVNSHYTNYGRDFGIRYVFGGGNKVSSALRTDVYVHGGMIDTAFAGGNEASVFRANIKVEVDNPNIIYRNGWTQDHDAAWAGSRPDTMASKWVGTRGSYNVRALFGGNNRAAMECVPDVRLVSGGIAAVYGGGNAGDMTNEELNIASGDHYYADWHVTAITHAKEEFSEAKNKIDPPQAALGTFVHVAGDADHMWIDYLYGGCRAANVAHATLVHVEGGNIGAIFGGCNISGNVGQAEVTHAGGRARGGTYVALDDNARIFNNLYGGSNGYYHCVDDEASATAHYITGVVFTDNQGAPFDMFNDYLGLTRPTHNFTHVAMNGGKVFGNVYGGGNHATVGFLNSSYGYPTPSGQQTGTASPKVGGVHLSLVKGEIFGNAFGGSNMATVYGLSYFYIGDKPNVAPNFDGGHMVIHGDVYGGNDRLGSVGNNVNVAFVDISGNEILASDGSAINEGGKAAYNTYILVEGTPQINRLFGGGNGAYNYNGEYPQYPDIDAYCSISENHTDVPVLASAFVDIHTAPTARIDTVFGGGNAADVQDRVMVLVNTQRHKFDDTDASKSDTTIGIIFGGNNVASMACVPTIELKKGVVGTVFGGGNMGHMMGATESITDLCGNSVPSVASFVHVSSDSATVTGAIFGGCNKADVHGMAYVLIENTSPYGIDTIYGGNDVSGRITGDTRVDVYGGKVGTIYGGSNGFYDYEELSPGDYRVRKFNHSRNDGDILYENSIGSPYVDKTNVNIYGGTVAHNIYGGGRMGDCRITNIYINDRTTDTLGIAGCAGATPSTILGYVFGGGEGDTAALDIAHRGNIYEATNVHLYHATSVIAEAYGGGKGGDVYNTNITSYETWDHSFQKIFGGCWGADVTGTAHLTLDANMAMLEENPSIFTADWVYGGNDFSGNCYRSEVVINSGRYDTIYGAGCGLYPASAYTPGANKASLNRTLFVPNNEEVVVTVNGEDNVGATTVWVNGELYGGGQLGTTMRYLKNAQGQHIDASSNVITSAAQEKVADTNTTVANAHTDPLDYAYIILNIHGGEYAKDIFAGAQGQDGAGQLVYGLKILNMDRGTVEQSLYGGSQAVSDGYSRQECNSGNSTMRPSSILNLMGGLVYNHVYGAGYKGFAYGSVYVNVGKHAIDSSTVWRTVYGPSASHAYSIFKPGLTPGLSDTLKFGESLMLRASVYAGANWGQNTGSFEFTGAGFFGGESRVLVDGLEYDDDHVMIEIANSVLGAGTSVLGGDILSRIDIRNYGSIYMCGAEKTLKAVQRADALYLHNTGIRFTGTPDASSALYSPDYAINKVDTVNAVGFNLIEIDAPKANIEVLRFFEDVSDMTCYDYTTYPQSGSCLIPASLNVLLDSVVNCRTTPLTDCDKIGKIHPVTNKHTAILMNNGVTIDVQAESGDFGEITGYAYLVAEDGTDPTVRARQKTGAGANDGGFSGLCTSENSNDGMVNTPYSNTYRYWNPGAGESNRTVVLLAHANPHLLPEDKAVKVTGTDGSTVRKLALAHTTITLPPSAQGNYYKLGISGVHISESNDKMSLIDVAWNPVSWDSPHDDSWQTLETSSTGEWFVPNAADGSSSSNFLKEDYIATDVNTIFGLVMASGEGFKTSAPNTYVAPSSATANFTNGATSISTSTHTTTLNTFTTAQVAENDVSPVIDLYLTYDSTLFNSILGSVKFVLVEYDSDGRKTGDSINVEAYVSTIINEFKDMSFDLIATTNEGESNIFLTRAILPATLKTQDLFIQSVKWYPTEPSLVPSLPYSGVENNKFQISGDRSYGGYILTSDENSINSNKYRFGVAVQPIENTSSSTTSDVGWYTISRPNTDVYNLVYSDLLGRRTNVSTTSNQSDYPGYPLATGDSLEASHVAFNDLTGPGNQGVQIGVLDGRGIAGLNFELFYDGRVLNDYPGYYIGDVVLGMAAYPTGVASATPSTFNITLHIKVRPGSDTLYVASANRIQRHSIGIDYESGWTNIRDGVTAKSPVHYVQTFENAIAAASDNQGNLKPNTVICVLDSVVVGAGQDITIEGSSSDEPLKIIRYEGHHNEAPHEEGVYRGPMIIVKDGGKLTMRNVILQGSAVAMRQFRNTSDTTGIYLEPNRLTARPSKSHLLADTNAAAAPIFSIRNGGTVHFADNVVVEENWNHYTGNVPHLRGGAISVTNGGILQLSNNVTIRKNLVTDSRTSHCNNGAVYVDRGIVEHPEVSAPSSAITLLQNYLIGTSGSVPTTQYWIPTMGEADPTKLYMWSIDSLRIDTTLDKANLFLMRKSNGSKGEGYLSDGMPLYTSAELTPTSRIGITKWFPGEPGNTLGEAPRDTIYFAYQDDFNQGMPTRLVAANVFSSDEGYNIRYSHGVNEQRIYLTRCATFRHQQEGETMDSEVDEHGFEHIIIEKNPLQFIADSIAPCPTGLDSLTYRVSKGMLPYTYFWRNNLTNQVQSTTTPYTSIEMWDALYWDYYDAVDSGDPDYLAEASIPLKETFENSINIPYLKLPIDTTSQVVDYTVSATDAFGCVVSKRIQIRYFKDRTIPADVVNRFVKTPTTAHWTDTNSYTHDENVIAKGDRSYRGVIIDAYAWPHDEDGTRSVKAVHADHFYAYAEGPVEPIDLDSVSFCEGDVINLQTPSEMSGICSGTKYKFSMWDFDPYYTVNNESLTSNYVVPNKDATIVAYYTPNVYWKDLEHEAPVGETPEINHVYSNTYFTPARNNVDAQTTYNDDLHIYTERGLAWFLKQVNGLDGLQVRQFYFNKVYIHQKPNGDPYDMKCYKWTPVGTSQYPFRGWVYGVGPDDPSVNTYADTTPLSAGNYVVIKNLIVDEPLMSHVGFFGHLDTARIQGLKFESAYIRGAHDAAVLAARSKNSRVSNVDISAAQDAVDLPRSKNTTGNPRYATSMIMTHNNSGGLIGYSENDIVNNVSVAAKFLGDAVYSGGVYGYANGSSAFNSTAYNFNRMNGVYLGGIAGYLDGVAPRNGLFRSKRAGQLGHIANNYVHLITPGTSSRVGGIVGYAQNAVIENNYVYGQVESSFTDGGLAAQVGNNTTADHNYYASDAAKQIVGSTSGSANLADNTDFAGSGNAVTLSDRVYGVDNLTRVLNIWVREQNANGANYKTWTSDLRHRNNGYPLFGQPDLIPVASQASLEGCEQVEWMGVLYSNDTVIVERYIDSTQMVDSTMSTYIRVHHATHTQYADSAYIGEEYMGHGFYVSAAESELLRRTLDSAGIAILVLSDTLQNANGCDSIVSLTLTFSATKGITDVSTTAEVKVYPNPTTSTVNVAAEGMTHVEVYDNEGRRLQDYSAQGQPVVTLDVRHLASGVYYLRVHTPTGVTIQKVIKR